MQTIIKENEGLYFCYTKFEHLAQAFKHSLEVGLLAKVLGANLLRSKKRSPSNGLVTQNNCLFFAYRPTVFDLISGLFAYEIFGKKTALISEPPRIFFFFFGKYRQRALGPMQFPLSFIFFVFIYPGCKTLREGRKSR